MSDDELREQDRQLYHLEDGEEIPWGTIPDRIKEATKDWERPIRCRVVNDTKPLWSKPGISPYVVLKQ